MWCDGRKYDGRNYVLGPESAASLPEAAAPIKKRDANAVTTLELRGGQLKKTRHGMAAAGLQPTPATTARMYLVVERPEDADGPSRGAKRTFAAMQARDGQFGPEHTRAPPDGAGQRRVCKRHDCGGPFQGGKRTRCPHCGRKEDDLRRVAAT